MASIVSSWWPFKRVGSASEATLNPRHRAASVATPARGIRYERGSQIVATDGPVGTLRQIVVDEEQAVVRALVVRPAGGGESVLVPPDLVESCDGSTLVLNVSRKQFARGASRSPRMEPRMFTAANLAQVARIVPDVFQGEPRRSVVSISRHRVETGDSLAMPPASPQAPAGSRWRHLGRARETT